MRCSAVSGARLSALLVLAAGVGGCAQTSTYGTGESPELAIFREMTGGLGAQKKEPIEYQPRAPLVMPASAAQLPPPVEAAQTADERWPKSNPAAGPRYGSEKPGEDMSLDEYKRLKPLAGLGRKSNRKFPDDNHNPVYDMMGNERKEFKAAIDDAEGLGTGRRYLTDPPESVREPAATAPVQFDEIKKKRTGVLSRLFGG